MSLKSQVIDKVSDVLSYPARRAAQKSMLQADQDVKDIKMVRNADKNHEEITPFDYRSPLFRARANVIGIKYRAEQDNQKAQKLALQKK